MTDVAMLTALIERWRRIRLPRPTAQQWDAAFAAGKWDYLHDRGEAARLALAAHLVALSLPADGRVLDVGCGEGALFAAIAHLPVSAYVGIDISAVAIERAAVAHASPRARFVVGDIERQPPIERFDVIVVNEMLYYVADVTAVIRRLLDALTPGGALVVSIYDKRKTRWLWRRLLRLTSATDLIALRNREGTRWRVARLMPR